MDIHERWAIQRMALRAVLEAAMETSCARRMRRRTR